MGINSRFSKNLLLFSGFIIITSSIQGQYYELASDIFILDKKAPIESFEELVEALEGKPFYLDRWATWCSPCIKEFTHSEELHEFLRASKIEMVYLNSDSEIEESEWFDFIVKHKLKGHHLRLESSLKSDLANKGLFIPRIPQYMIVNGQGEVIDNNALRPSNGEELQMQIRLKLNL